MLKDMTDRKATYEEFEDAEHFKAEFDKLQEEMLVQMDEFNARMNVMPDSGCEATTRAYLKEWMRDAYFEAIKEAEWAIDNYDDGYHRDVRHVFNSTRGV